VYPSFPGNASVAFLAPMPVKAQAMHAMDSTVKNGSAAVMHQSSMPHGA
jgi:hypothetical protein